MSYQIEDVMVLALGTGETKLELGCESFLLENCSESATVYFRESDADGKACTESNGFALGPGRCTCMALAARTLSLCASAEGTEARVLLVDVL